MVHCPKLVGARAAHGAMQEQGCTELRAPRCGYAGGAGGQTDERMHQDIPVALLGVGARTVAARAGDAHS